MVLSVGIASSNNRIADGPGVNRDTTILAMVGEYLDDHAIGCLL